MRVLHSRLYLRIYAAVIASLVLVVLVAGAVWHFGAQFSPANQAFEIVGGVAAAVLPPAALRSWSVRTVCCSPTPRTSCARRSRASGSHSSYSGARAKRNTRPTSSATWRSSRP